MLYYTGVGSRNTPKDILLLMELIAQKMYNSGVCLRTGDAFGADKAFVIGSNGLNRIYTTNDTTTTSMLMAKKFHGAWNRLSPFAQKLHGRNPFQVLGKKLNDPSVSLICWTPDGCISHRYRTKKTGGTGTAISIADDNGVRVHNLKNAKTMKSFEEFIKE